MNALQVQWGGRPWSLLQTYTENGRSHKTEETANANFTFYIGFVDVVPATCF